LLAGAVLAFAAVATSAADPPRRIVSFNLCADQLAVALADREQIAGLSPFSADPELSVVAEQAANFPRPSQRSEATVAMQPDLVLVGPHDRSAMRRVLTDLGIPVREVPLVTDILQAQAQAREFADLLGHPERGERLAAAIGRAQSRLHAAAGGRHATALLVERGGYAAGAQSLAGALLAEAGLRAPRGAPEGLGGFVPLERLLQWRPDYLVLYEPVGAAADQGMLFLTHPTLRELYPTARRLLLPRRYSLCGGPALVEALDYLAREIRKVSLR
jgi:iron complex transport system substrate-binding protein